MARVTREDVATDFNLWREYVDQRGEMTRGEFESLTVQERLDMQREIWCEVTWRDGNE